MKIGVMNHPSKSICEEITFFGKHGFDFVDLTIEGPNAFNVDVDEIKAILDLYNMSITGHTDPCLPFSYPIQSIRNACLGEFERCARIFSGLGASVMNIHPCYQCPPAMKQSLLELNIEALKPIVEMATSHGLSVSSFETLLDAVPNLGLHLDVGHTNFGHDDSTAFCRKLGKSIKHVHFSDNRSTADHHMPLGVGNINWGNAVKSLKATGYNDTITLEIFCDDPRMRFKYLDLSRKYVQDLWD